MAEYPALDLIWRQVPDDEQVEQLLAEIDDAHPTAVETRADGVRVFFATAASRDRAAALLQSQDDSLTCVPLSVPDEDWAARSQASLGPVRVGRLVIAPPHRAGEALGDTIEIVIQPSMGFGTGHHATTRLCLRLLQTLEVAGRAVLDVGTGSGVLAIAAARLGASPVQAIDNDPDALQAAQENVERNSGTDVTLALHDLSVAPLPTNFDVVLANLTGATIERFASQLRDALGADGQLIVSGFQMEDEVDVRRALRGTGLVVAAREQEEEWVAALFHDARLGFDRSRPVD